MASEVQICNLALSHVGAASIQSLEDKTKEAKECNALYEPARDAVLREHKWSFATQRQTLAVLPDEEKVDQWEFVYAYPADCFAARDIYNDLNNATRDGLFHHDHHNLHGHAFTDRINFEVALNKSKTAKIIFTNKDEAELIYTASITDPNLFDTQFRDALAWNLASQLARPLRANLRMEEAYYQKYLFILATTQASDSNEQQAKPDETNIFVQARR